MKNCMISGLVLSLFIVASCSNDDGNPQETYDGVEFATILQSRCQGDVYGQGVNVIDLKLSTGSIHIDGEGMEFEGEGTCLVLSLLGRMTENMLPSEGNYSPADWNEMKLEQTFDPGYCEYQEDYGWLVNGTYAVTIDKDGHETYTAFTAGELTLSPTTDGYEINIALKSGNGEVFKARYKGAVEFEVPVPEEKYKYEEKTLENLAPLANSVDIYNFGEDMETGMTKYKISVWMEKQIVGELILYMPVTTFGEIPDGKYSVNAYPMENALQAGYYENEKFVGSYIGQFDEAFMHVLRIWYMVGGELDIKSSGNMIEIAFNATSAYGSFFIINYKGEYKYTEVKPA